MLRHYIADEIFFSEPVVAQFKCHINDNRKEKEKAVYPRITLKDELLSLCSS